MVDCLLSVYVINSYIMMISNTLTTRVHLYMYINKFRKSLELNFVAFCSNTVKVNKSGAAITHKYGSCINYHFDVYFSIVTTDNSS